MEPPRHIVHHRKEHIDLYVKPYVSMCLMWFKKYLVASSGRSLNTIMEEVKLELNGHGDGAFYLFIDDQIAAKMLVGAFPGKLNVYHTEAMIEGKGYAKKLLEAMVAHAREHNLKVIPYCPYVLAQFKRHPEQYADIWNQERPAH